MTRTVEVSLLVREDAVRALLIELADDERVKAVTAKVGDGKYLVPSRAESDA